MDAFQSFHTGSNTSAHPVVNFGADFNGHMLDFFPDTNANHSSLIPSLGAFESLHLQGTLPEVDASDKECVETIARSLLALQDISEGRHVVKWAELVDPSHPVESARLLNEALSKPTTQPLEAFPLIALSMTTPAHLAIITYLEDQYKTKVRDAVLQDLLNALTTVGDQPMPLCSEMLVEMVCLNLVVLRGVAATIEALLNDPSTRRAGMAVLGRLAEKNRNSEPFLRTLQNVQPLVRQWAREKDYEYDVAVISRLLGWADMDKAATLVPAHHIPHDAPVTCFSYFRGRDELVTGCSDGTVAFWGTPDVQKNEVPVSKLDFMPKDCIPVAMSGASREFYLVVATMPCPPSHPFYPSMDSKKKLANNKSHPNTTSSSATINNSSATNLSAPSFHIYTHTDGLTWNNADVISRSIDTTLTCVSAVSNTIFCSAESYLDASFLRHNLVLTSPVSRQVVRTFDKAHDDYITVLCGNDNSDQILLSGSKDATVKLWDVRNASTQPSATPNAATNNSNPNNNGHADGNGSFRKLDTGNHTDTISCIYTLSNFLFTGSMDGSMHIFDLRQLDKPVATKEFLGPVLGITALEGGRAAVATGRGLYLFSLESLSTLDVLTNTVYTQIASNRSRNAVFAAGSDGVTIFSLKK